MAKIEAARVTQRVVHITLDANEIADAIALFARRKMKKGWKRPPLESMDVTVHNDAGPIFVASAVVEFTITFGDPPVANSAPGSASAGSAPEVGETED